MSAENVQLMFMKLHEALDIIATVTKFMCDWLSIIPQENGNDD